MEAVNTEGDTGGKFFKYESHNPLIRYVLGKFFLRLDILIKKTENFA
jgi:hypothetical protein